MSEGSYGGQIVTVPFDHGTKVNEKIFKLKPGQLPYGNGCPEGGNNCFECLLPECVFKSSYNYTIKGTGGSHGQGGRSKRNVRL